MTPLCVLFTTLHLTRAAERFPFSKVTLFPHRAFLEFPRVSSQAPEGNHSYEFVAISHPGVLHTLFLNENVLTRVGCPPESPNTALSGLFVSTTSNPPCIQSLRITISIAKNALSMGRFERDPTCSDT